MSVPTAPSQSEPADLVALGVDLAQVTTLSTLREGLRYCIRAAT